MDNRKKNRYEFIEELFEQIERIPIEQIIGRYVNLVQRGQHKMGLCPFHADTKLGSFIVTPQKKIWKCFACGDGFAGNGVKFVSLYENLTYLEAAFRIGVQYNIISMEEYESYMAKRWDPGYVRKLEKRYSDKKMEKESPTRAPESVINKVYLELKNCCTLSEVHLRHLKEVRKLSDDRIQKDYFTFPTSWKKKESIVKTIQEKTRVSNDLLMTVPGFFLDRKSNHISFSSYKGIGILIRDARDKVIGIQIRRDEVKEGEQRYRWFSSSFAFYNPTEYAGGCGCGSPCDVLFPNTSISSRSCLCITEGRFKSEFLSMYGNTAISIQGVSTWRGSEITIRYIMESGRNIQSINLFFDSDLLGNYPLIQHLSKMVDTIRADFPQTQIRYALWSKNFGKGIDDCILNGHISEVRFFPTDKVICTCKETWEEILSKYEISSVRDLDVPTRQKFVLDLQLCNEKKLLY